MDAEKNQQLAADKTQIRHIALELASNWLANNAKQIAEGELANHKTADNEEIFAAFFDPVKAEIERIAGELQGKASFDLMTGSWPMLGNQGFPVL